jgi:hypothetical protein
VEIENDLNDKTVPKYDLKRRQFWERKNPLISNSLDLPCLFLRASMLL